MQSHSLPLLNRKPTILKLLSYIILNYTTCSICYALLWSTVWIACVEVATEINSQTEPYTIIKHEQ